jgi:hypothetical protein
MGVKLLFTLLCDDVRLENTGKFVLVGVYNYVLSFQPIAGTSPNPSETRLSMQKLCLFRRWVLDQNEVPIKTDIVGTEGKTVMSVETKLIRPPDNTFCHEVIQLFGPVFSPGIHRILTKYQDGTAREVEDSFEVRLVLPN